MKTPQYIVHNIFLNLYKRAIQDWIAIYQPPPKLHVHAILRPYVGYTFPKHVDLV